MLGAVAGPAWIVRVQLGEVGVRRPRPRPLRAGWRCDSRSVSPFRSGAAHQPPLGNDCRAWSGELRWGAGRGSGQGAEHARRARL